MAVSGEATAQACPRGKPPRCSSLPASVSATLLSLPVPDQGQACLSLRLFRVPPFAPYRILPRPVAPATGRVLRAPKLPCPSSENTPL